MNLDDVAICGTVNNILHDLEVIKKAKTLGLALNNNKSEIISVDRLHAAQIVSPEKAFLLGSTLGNVTAIDDVLLGKSTAL